MIPQTWRSLLCNSCRKHVVKQSGKWKDTSGHVWQMGETARGLCINIWIWRYGEERGRLSVLQTISPKSNSLGIPVFITGPSISWGKGKCPEPGAQSLWILSGCSLISVWPFAFLLCFLTFAIRLQSIFPLKLHHLLYRNLEYKFSIPPPSMSYAKVYFLKVTTS